MDSITAHTADELIKQLSSIDISVPFRTEGRTTEHCERWSICRLLASIYNSERFHFPVYVEHRDRPDFLARFGNQEYGIEVTEVIHRNAAAIDAYREHSEVDGPFYFKRYIPGDVPLKGNDLKGAALSNKSGSCWAGDSVEREWATAMAVKIAEKVTKANKDGFELFTENWLLMYDNWRLPNVDRALAAKMLFCRMNNDDYGPFNRIWIESGKQVWCVCAAELYSCDIPELWKE